MLNILNLMKRFKVIRFYINVDSEFIQKVKVLVDVKFLIIYLCSMLDNWVMYNY